MKISDKGINLIKSFEGCKLKAYLCPANVWTIGYGHTKGVYKGMEITQDKAEELLLQDLKEFEDGINDLKLTLNQNQYDALVSFAFNVGLGNLRSSTLFKCIKSKQYKAAAEQFSKWIYAKGKISTGLINRRAKEKELFES